MTVLLPRLSEDLTAAAEALAARPRRRRPSLRVAGFVAAGTLTAAGVAAGATALWSPPIGDGSGRAKATGSAPPATQVAALGVLRREQTDADRGAESLNTLKYLDGHGDVRTGSVRLLGTQEGGAGFVLVPVVGPAPATSQQGLTELLRAKKAEAEGRPVPPPATDQLCLFARDPAGSGGAARCFTLQQVLDGKATLGFVRPGHRIQFGLVADGIARVRADDGTTADVHDNFFQLQAGGPLHFLDDHGAEVMPGPGG
jgi:hypothetical protein